MIIQFIFQFQTFQQQTQNMKSQQDKQNQQNYKQQSHSQTQSKQQNTNEDLFKNINIQCSGSQQGYQYCINKGCQGQAVICKNDDCQCNSQHKQCIDFSRVDKLHKKLNNKVIRKSIKQFLQEIQSKTNQITDKVSQLYDKVTKQIKTFGLNNSQEQFYKIISKNYSHDNNDKKSNSNQYQQILNGDQSFHCKYSFYEDQVDWFNYSINKYKNIVKNTKQSIQPYFQELENIITYYHVLLYSTRQSFISHKQSTLCRYFHDSMIVTNVQPLSVNFNKSELYRLTNILSTNLISTNSIRKVYSFNAQKPNVNGGDLLKTLEGKQNLLYLVTNAHGKKFGVFNTPKFQANQTKQKQQSNQSFLFSLDLNVAQQLTNSNISHKLELLRKTISMGEIYSNNNKTDRNGFKLQYTTFGLQGSKSIKCQLHLNQNQPSLINVSYNYVNGVNYNNASIPQVKYLEIYQLDCKPKVCTQKKAEVTNVQNNPFSSKGQGLFTSLVHPFQQKSVGPIFGNGIPTPSLFSKQ